MKILNRKEIKRFLNNLKEQFGISSLDLDYIFLKTLKDKIFIVSKDLAKLDLKNFKRINSIGLYFAKIEVDGIRLSIEGSQILGKKITKNILELENPTEWLLGRDIENKSDLRGYVLVKHKDDFLGTGKASETKISNFIPKIRRISEVIS